MPPWGRRERSADEQRARAADEALRDSVDELRAEHQDVERTIKQAADALRDAERDRAKRITAAERQLAEVSANPRILGVGGLLQRKAEILDTTVRVPEGEFPIERSIRARVHSEGRKTQKYDSRKLLLLIEAGGWASTVKLNPDADTQAAHQFAQTLNVRARSMDTINAQRAQNIATAERALAAARGDRQAVDALQRRLVAVTEDGARRLRGPRAVVEMNLEAIDADARAARKAREALDKAVIAPPQGRAEGPVPATRGSATAVVAPEAPWASPLVAPEAPRVSGPDGSGGPGGDAASEEGARVEPETSRQGSGTSPDSQPDIFEQIRRLGELRDAGVLTQDEFDAKKQELLGRL